MRSLVSTTVLCAAFSFNAVYAQMRAETMYVNIDAGPGKASTISLELAGKSTTFAEKYGVLNIIKDKLKPILQIDAKNGTAESIMSTEGDLIINGTLIAADMDIDDSNDMASWFLLYTDLFNKGSAGWSQNYTSACGSPWKILGGHCKFGGNGWTKDNNRAMVEKTYNKLPPHSHIRVQTRFFFIDQWESDTAFMQLGVDNMKYAWTEQYSWCDQPFSILCTKGKSFCGKDDYPDRLARLVDVSHPHSDDSLTVAFGTTLGDVDPCDASWGISGISIYIK